MDAALTEFKEIRSCVSADKRGRIVLGNEAKKKDYSVSINDKGQVLLTPIVHVPEYEAWLYRNPRFLFFACCLRACYVHSASHG